MDLRDGIKEDIVAASIFHSMFSSLASQSHATSPLWFVQHSAYEYRRCKILLRFGRRLTLSEEIHFC